MCCSHLLVLLKARGIPLAAVMAELERRTAKSGLAEKSRKAGLISRAAFDKAQADG